MSEFDDIALQIEAGLAGKNSSVSMGFHKLNKYIGIRKKILTLVFGATGSGKSSLVYDAWILNTFDWWIERKKATQVKVKPILFSFERSKIYTKTKWLSRRISKDEHDMVLMYEDYINELMEYVTVIEGAQNPTGPYRYMKAYAEKHGKIEQVSEHHSIYHPNNENEVVVPIIDHIGLTKLERDYKTKKESIDKLTEYAQGWRDYYGYSPVFVAQITRELGSVQYQKMTEFEPTIDQIKESGAPGEAADVVMSIFDPIRYNTNDAGGYEARKFMNPETGEKPFRSIKIIKNTYGCDGVRCGAVMNGATGLFRELPRKDDITDAIYDSVKKGTYYL
jgi:hypothetical protein